ncbi:MAG: hypothetical protein ABW194_11700 [Novosphingobium sp.]
MQIDQIEHCRRRVVEEERLAEAASSGDIAERHYQMAMLYKVQLSVLQRKCEAIPPPAALA